MAEFRIRTARPDDERALYEICLRTGHSGEDASGRYRDPDLLGAVYAGPYLALDPEFAFVAEDGGGVAGYVLGAPDTRAFQDACEQHWWPPLRRRYPLSAFPEDGPDARLVRHIHHPWQSRQEVLAEYPAHLHIDLLPRCQGQGNGRRLLTVLFDALTVAGVTGVHLGVGAANRRAIGFYRRMGFTELITEPYGLIMGHPLPGQRQVVGC